MKRILFFLLLLVNLQLTIDNGSLSIGFGEIVAQRTQEEQLSASEIPGYSKVPCEYCSSLIQENLLSEHKSVYCSKRPSGQQPTNNGTMCSSCKKPESECKCGMVGGVCSFCKKPVDFCNCLNVTGNGSKNTGSLGNIPAPTGGVITIPDIEPTPTPPNNGGGGGSGGSGSWGGGSVIGYQWSNGSMQGGESSSTINVCYTTIPLIPVESSGPLFKRIPIKTLKSMPGVTLLPNLPNMLPVQKKQCECTVMALALMAQYAGRNYENARTVLTNLAEKKYNLKDQGVPISAIQSVYSQYCEIEDYPFVHSLVEQKISNGTPLAALKKKRNENGTWVWHMVTIIGFDAEYYYVAAWGSTSANQVPKDTLREDLYKVFEITNVNTPYK